ncbi:hypothetical protein GW755_02455 [bacterium]|nr:hypothetical protein [bacterium]
MVQPEKKLIKLFKIVFSLFFGLLQSALVVSIVFTLINFGKPHDAGDLAGFVLILFLTPILSIPISFMFHLDIASKSLKPAFFRLFTITFISFIIYFVLDFLLRGN